MIVKHLDQITGTERDVHAETWQSRRLLLAKDRVGFSLHDTIMYAGTHTLMWYRHHVEAVYCVTGEGELEVLDDGSRYQIGPGTLYTLNGHERHIMHPRSDMRLICVFNPPVTGMETHDAEGAYPPPVEVNES